MRTTAQRALSLDPTLHEAHAVLALASVLDYDWLDAGRHFQRATVSEHIAPMVQYFHALFYLAPVGRMSEAVGEVERVLREDPLNLLFRTTLGFFHIGVGNYAAGERELGHVLELDENYWIAIVWMSLASFAQGRLTEALKFAERMHSVVPSHPVGTGLLAALLTKTGNVERAKELHGRLGAGDAYGAPAGLFCFHAVRSEWDLAASWFEKSIRQRDTRAPWISPRMFIDRFVSSDRWPALAKMMNLPAAES